MSDDEDALLAASRKAYREKANHKKSGNRNEQVFTDGTDMIQFEDEEDDTYRNDLTSPKPVKETSAKKRGKQRQIPKEDVTDSALHALEVTPVTTTRKPSKREVEEVCKPCLSAVSCQVGRPEMVWNACFRWSLL